MTKRTKNILLGIIIFLIVVNIGSIIMKKLSDNPNDGNLAGRISDSLTSVKINGTAIPAYGLKNMVYIAAEDLQMFNFSIDRDDEEKTYKITNNIGDYTVDQSYAAKLSHIESKTGAVHQKCKIYLNQREISGYRAGEYMLIPVNALENIGTVMKSDTSNVLECTLVSTSSGSTGSGTMQDISITPPTVAPGQQTLTVQETTGKVIVLDPGHGLSSGSMSDDEKSAAGWIYNDSKGEWGEWRHWKSGDNKNDCNGSGCSGRVPDGGSCWYSIGNGDRDVEPDINLQNCLAAKKYLEQMGYTVRLTRSTNEENPSITERLKSCYPNKNTSAAPDVLAYVCIHSNAGGGNGSAYIQLSGAYDQAGIPSNYADAGNALGKGINDKITSQTSLSAYSGGSIDMPELIAFCKSPVVCAYLEIGFFDNSSDLSILQSESDAIGKAIAEGISEYFG